MKEDAEAMESWQSFQDSTTETLIEVYTGKRLAAGMASFNKDTHAF